MYQVQRRSPRIDLASGVTLVSPEGKTDGVLENVSLHGMLVRTDAFIPVGEVAEIYFLDIDAPGHRYVKASAVVVRSDKGWVALELRKMDLDSVILLREIHGQKIAEA
jgi:hypothetical protein